MAKKYDFQKIEKKWQKVWQEEKIYEPDLKNTQRPFYNLMMFPYPSAEGLHVGNMYAFTGSDVYGRFKRMQGNDVFEPIGLDGFGIHSENYALKIGAHPMTQAEISEKRFYEQLKMIGNGFAWDEHLETYDPEYYKWTQWIFTQMWKHGLAYRKKQAVNWCPSCKTVLADEQVIKKSKIKNCPFGTSPAGRQKSKIQSEAEEETLSVCERCETKVVKKELEQWFFRITKYAERLLQNLEKIDWSEKIKIAQRNWIGRSEGTIIRFKIVSRTDAEHTQTNAEKGQHKSESSQRESVFIEVFTTRPDTLFGATYMVVAPEYSQIENWKSKIENWKEVKKYIESAKKKSEEERVAETNPPAGGKTGVEIKGIKAINPTNNEEIPIFVADYVLSGYGTGAIMAVPAHDERDFEFAKTHNLEIKPILNYYYEQELPQRKVDEYLVVNHEETKKITDEKVLGFLKKQAQKDLSNNKVITREGYLFDSGDFNGLHSQEAKWAITKLVGGERKIQYRLRDWLLSRQRYWGAPIPMIFCDACAAAGKGGQPAPTGVSGKEMPGWYAVPEKDLPVELPFIKEFRPQGKNESPLASVKEFYETKCPACGGKARRETDVSDTFLDSAWYYLGYIILGNQKSKIKNQKFEWDAEMVKKWLPVNIYIGGAEHAVLHLLYSRFVTMAFHDFGMLDFEEPFTIFRAHGLLIKDGAKMSKSKGNVVNPDEYVKNFGADAFRMYLMFLAPFEQGGDFRDEGILGITRFLDRVWKMGMEVSKGIEVKKNPSASPSTSSSSLSLNGPSSGPRGSEQVEREMIIHQTIKKVTEDIEGLQYNTAISALMVLLNGLEKNGANRENFEIFLKLLAPFSPHITEELWHVLENTSSIHVAPWPKFDSKLATSDTVDFVVQVNGKHRGTLRVNRGIKKEEIEKLARAEEKVTQALKNEKIIKVIFIPNRLINFVV